MRYHPTIEALAIALGALGCSSTIFPPPPPPPKVAYQTNATFLSGHFLFDVAPFTASARITDDWASRAIPTYQVPIWLPQAGTIDPNNAGLLKNPATSAATFLNHVAAYESANATHLTLLAVLNGDATQLDLGDPTVQANIVADCTQFFSIAGASRAFDGCALDIEPAGDPTVYANIKAIVIALRHATAGKRIAIAAPKLMNPKPADGYYWNSSDFYYMGEYVDYLLVMTYDTHLTSASAYTSWIATQTDSILVAVSGARWGYDANHPQETSGVQVLMGMEGYATVTASHDPGVENVQSAAPGILAGVQSLQSTDSVSATFLAGAFMFQHDGGAATFTATNGTVAPSPFALYSTDWAAWRTDWLSTP